MLRWRRQEPEISRSGTFLRWHRDRNPGHDGHGDDGCTAAGAIAFAAVDGQVRGRLRRFVVRQEAKTATPTTVISAADRKAGGE